MAVDTTKENQIIEESLADQPPIDLEKELDIWEEPLELSAKVSNNATHVVEDFDAMMEFMANHSALDLEENSAGAENVEGLVEEAKAKGKETYATFENELKAITTSTAEKTLEARIPGDVVVTEFAAEPNIDSSPDLENLATAVAQSEAQKRNIGRTTPEAVAQVAEAVVDIPVMETPEVTAEDPIEEITEDVIAGIHAEINATPQAKAETQAEALKKDQEEQVERFKKTGEKRGMAKVKTEPLDKSLTKEEAFDILIKKEGIDFTTPDVSAEVVEAGIKAELEQTPQGKAELEKATRDFLNKQTDEKFLKTKKEGTSESTETSAKKTVEVGTDAHANTFYDRMRKVPFLAGMADTMEAKSATKKVDALNIDLAKTEAKMERKIAEMLRTGQTREQVDAMPEIIKLKEKAEWLNGEAKSYERRRDAAAEVTKLRINEQIAPQTERVRQIEEGISNFKQEIDNYNALIAKMQADATELGPLASKGALSSFKKAEKAAKASIDTTKERLGKLIIEKNSLNIKLTDAKVAAGIFDGLKTENATSERTTTFDYAGGGRLERISEKTESALTPEAGTENINNKAPLTTFIDKWNGVVERYNSINARKGEPLLPVIEGKESDFEEILEKVKTKIEDANADALSPKAFKLFIQAYAKKNEAKALDMSERGQTDFVDALKETMRESEIEDVSNDLYKINKKKAESAQAKAEAKPQVVQKKEVKDTSSIPLAGDEPQV